MFKLTPTTRSVNPHVMGGRVRWRGMDLQELQLREDIFRATHQPDQTLQLTADTVTEAQQEATKTTEPTESQLGQHLPSLQELMAQQAEQNKVFQQNSPAAMSGLNA